MIGKITLATLVLAVAVYLVPSSARSASPTNLGQTRLVVTDFGADNSGLTDARPGIQAAVDSCNSTVGCSVYFPAGTYLLNTPPPMSTAVITIPAGVPVTLEGVGQAGSVLQPITGSTGYDIISAAAGSSGFAMHDLGMNFTTVPVGGAAIRVSSAATVSLYNLLIQGAYDDIALGQTGATSAATQYTNIRGINARNSKHCFLRLDGGVLDTYLRGSYAQANAVANSQIVCSPSTQVSGAFGVQGLYLSDSTFLGFARGLSFAANVTQLSDLHFDNIYLDVANSGPAFELFVPLGSSSVVQNISVTNSTLQSAGTACVVHGSASAVKLRNVECDGGIPAPLPGTCGTTYPRGFALVDILNSAGSSIQTVQLTVTPSDGVPITASTMTYSGESPAAIASALGLQVNNSTLVTRACPVLVPVQSFTDFSGTDRSVGQELEIYSYAYSTGTNVTPAVTGSVVGAGAVQIILPNVTATFAPADDIYVGAPPGVPAPSSISVAASHASMATNGAGLHLQGGSSLLFSGNTFGDLLAPNQYAVQVDVPSVSYSSVLLQDNNFAAFSNAAVHFSSGTGSGLGPAIEFIGNIGYNPTGHQSASIACNTPTTNPFPFPVEVYVVGAFGSIAKNGTTIYTDPLLVAENAVILLGANETITIICGTGPISAWFGE